MNPALFKAIQWMANLNHLDHTRYSILTRLVTFQILHGSVPTDEATQMRICGALSEHENQVMRDMLAKHFTAGPNGLTFTGFEQDHAA